MGPLIAEGTESGEGSGSGKFMRTDGRFERNVRWARHLN